MQTTQCGSVRVEARRHPVKAFIHALLLVTALVASGCVWVPWGPCWGPGPRGGARPPVAPGGGAPMPR